MNSSSNKKNKLILIAGLSVVFILVAYVRFFADRGIHGASGPVASAGAFPAAVVPPGREAGSIPETPGTDRPALRTLPRDIFTGGQVEFAAGDAKAPAQGIGGGMPQPTFKLGGVIADQGSAIAVINGKFLRKGDWIEEYQIIGIDDSRIVLNGTGGQKIVLNLLKTMDKQF